MTRFLQRLTCAALGVILVLAPGIGTLYAQDDEMKPSAVEENKALVLAFVEADNTADYDALDELLTDDFQRHSSATPGLVITNREEMKQFMQANHATFPDFHAAVKMIAAEADLVALYVILTATMEGPLGEFPPTGASLEAPYMAMFRIEDGLIAELWVEWDNVNFLSQLGLFPPPAGD